MEGAQSKIEGLNFDARKQLLDFDNVLNTQRESIYAKRREILQGRREDLVGFAEELKIKYPDAQQIFEDKQSQLRK